MNTSAMLTLNFQYPNIANVVYAVQGDRQSRQIVAHLVDGSEPWVPPAGAYGMIRCEKPDGTIAVYDTLENGDRAVNFASSVALIGLAEQVLTAAGAGKMSLMLFNAAGSRLSTFRFTLVVTLEAVADNVISSNYISVFTATLAEMAQIANEVKAAYGAPLTAATAAAMTDTGRIYVYTGPTGGGFTVGNWYYWNGSAWVSGGVYNSADPAAAEAAAAAQESATQAQTAQGNAEDAQAAAETAQGKAEDAQAAAETAQGNAEDAQAAAETAQGNAEDAQAAAETAKTGAETAQAAAETAQAAAESAQAEAEAAAGYITDPTDNKKYKVTQSVVNGYLVETFTEVAV